MPSFEDWWGHSPPWSPLHRRLGGRRTEDRFAGEPPAISAPYDQIDRCGRASELAVDEINKQEVPTR